MTRLYFTKLSFILFSTILILVGCSKPEVKEAYYLHRGNEYFDKGELEKARIEYKNAGRIKPADPEVAYRFASVDEAEGDIRGAFAGFTQAEQQDPHYRPALLKLIEYYLAGERADDAEKRLKTVLADAPNDSDVLAMQAAYLLRTKDFDGAEKAARSALSHDQSNVVAYSALTGMYLAKDDETNAIKTVDDGISHSPKNLALLLLKATIYERSNDLQNTASTYQTIFQLAPNNSQYRANLALIYLNAGRIDDAEKTLRDGIAALPDNWDMKHQLIAFLAEHRGFDEAESEIHKLMQTNPNNPELNNWLVDLYMSHNETDQAVAFLNQIITQNQFDRQGLDARTILARIDYIKGEKEDAGKLATDVLDKDPGNVDALFIRAHLEFDKGFYQDAISDLRSIIRDRPKAKEALHLLSETLLMQGHLDLAIDTLEQLVELDPLNFAARVRLAQLYQQNGDSSRAMDALFFITKTAPNYAPAWETVARIAIAKKDWASAETAIDKLDKLENQHLTSVLLRGLLLANRGNPTEALEQYKEVISADPSSSLSEYALKSLVLAYQAMGQPEEATRYLEALKTDNPDIHTILGEAYLISGKSDQAAVDFDSAIAAHSSRQDPYLDRAKMLLFDHKTDQALDVLKQGAIMAPADIRAPILEAEILGKAGRYQEAITIYEALLAKNPELDGIANNLAEIIADYEYSDPNALSKAERIAERFSASSNPLFLDTLAWVYYRQGNLNQAETIMQRIVTEVSELPPEVHYHNAAILLKAGRSKDAKNELQKAIKDDKPYPGIEDAKKMLQGL